MNIERKTFAFAAILTLTFTLNSKAQTRVGGGLVYGTEIENIGINLNGQYFIKENIAIAPGLNYFFPKALGSGFDLNWFEINANGHYYFNTGSIEPYALAGLNFAFLSVKSSFGDSSNTEVGLNLGGGANFDIGSSIKPFGELRIVIGDADQLVLGGGVRFTLGG